MVQGEVPSFKMEALERELEMGSKSNGCSELISSPEGDRKEKEEKIPALDQKQEKCSKLITIRGPTGFVPTEISRENYRIMAAFSKQT